MQYLLHAIIAGLSFAILGGILTYLARFYEKKLIFFLLFTFLTIEFLPFANLAHIDLKLIFLAFLASIFSFLGNYENLRAMILAENPSYAQAASFLASSISLYLFGLLFLGSKLDLRKLLGFFLALLGITLMTI